MNRVGYKNSSDVESPNVQNFTSLAVADRRTSRLITKKCDYTDKRLRLGGPGVMRQIAINNDGSGES